MKAVFSRLRGEILWIVTGQFLAFLGGFIGIKILTNMLGPAGYGHLALGLTIAGLFTMYFYGPLANAVARYYVVYKERNSLRLYFFVLKKSHAILALILLFSSVMVGSIAAFVSGIEWALIIFVSSLFGIASGINASYISLQSSIRQRKIVALHQGADVWLRIGIAVLFLWLLGKTGAVAIAGYFLGTLLITVSQSVFALKKPEISSAWTSSVRDREAERSSFRELSGYAASFMVFSTFAAISMYADRWVIQGFIGESAVGIYAAIFQIAVSPVNIFFAMLNQLVVPIVFERAGAMTTREQASKSSEVIQVVVIISSLVMLSVALFFWCFSQQIVALFTSSEFVGDHRLLPLLVSGNALFNIAQIFTLKGSCFNSPRVYFWPKALQSLSFLAASCYMAKIMGLLGVALALCLSSAMYLALVVAVNRKLNFIGES